MQCSAMFFVVHFSAVQAVQCSAVLCISLQCSVVQEVKCSAGSAGSAVQCSAVQLNSLQCSVVQCIAVNYSASSALTLL